MVLREKLGRSVVEESSNVGASGTPHNPSSVTTEEAKHGARKPTHITVGDMCNVVRAFQSCDSIDAFVSLDMTNAIYNIYCPVILPRTTSRRWPKGDPVGARPRALDRFARTTAVSCGPRVASRGSCSTDNLPRADPIQ